MPERVIALVAGESGTGKSFFVGNLKQALIFDTDIGGGLAYLDARIRRNQSERVQAGSYVEVLDDLRRRQHAGNLKDVLTVGIDHVSALQQESALRHNPSLERDFGRSNDVATREWRKIREFCRNQDFNLICVAHLKAKWEQEKAVGLTADAAKNIEGDMGVVLQLRRAATYPSQAWVQKWRRDPEDERGAIPTTFPFSIEEFEKLAGPGMFSPREPIALASPEQVSKLTQLLEVTKLPEGTTEKWFKKAAVETFEEFTAADLQKCIDYVQKLLDGASGKEEVKAPKLKKGA